jgi:Ca-activated chloride channel family protein
MLRFANPVVFHLLWLLPVLIVGLFFLTKLQTRQLAKFGNPALLHKPGFQPLARWLKMGFLILVMILLIFALARPQMGTRTKQVERKGLNIFFALDASKSMLAEDLPPNRLTRAKEEIRDFAGKLKGDNVGLIVFAGSAFIQAPLTFDSVALNVFLDDVKPDQVPDPGTAIGEAIEKAQKAFGAKASRSNILILLTDGEDTLGDPLPAARAAGQAGIRIYVVGIGSPEGQPIPLRDENGGMAGYKKDRNGNTVMTRLNEPLLMAIANAANGKYVRASSRTLGLEALYADLMNEEKQKLHSQSLREYGERFQLPLGLALLVLVLEMLIGEKKRSRPHPKG